MRQSQGFTLIEIIVVLTIIAVCVAFTLPNFLGPTEQARAQTAQNNLLAIYSAEQNFLNNNNTYYSSQNPAQDDSPGIDTALGLNIPTDGTYQYDCSGVTCTATRGSPSPGAVTITLTLNKPIALTGGGTLNPLCSSSGSYSTWCNF